MSVYLKAQIWTGMLNQRHSAVILQPGLSFALKQQQGHTGMLPLICKRSQLTQPETEWSDQECGQSIATKMTNLIISCSIHDRH